MNDTTDTIDSEDIAGKYNAPEQTRKPFNPLTSESVNEKSYAKPNIKITQKEASEPIPEPIFMPPPVQPKKEEASAPKTPPPPVNPQVSELPSKDKEMAAKQAAAMAINAYEALHQLGNHAISISDGKVKKLTRKNLIDIKMPIPLGGEVISVGDYINVYNQELGTTFKVTDKFKNEVTPVLERVFEKKGIGATDEQMLMYLVGKDLVGKGFQVAQLMKAKNEMINSLIEYTKSRKGQGGAPAHNINPNPPAAPTPDYNTTAPAQPTPTATTYSPAYSSVPTPPSFDDEVEEPEIIPNEDVFDNDSSIPEHQMQEVHQIVSETKTKRAYNKKPRDPNAPKKGKK